MNHYCTYFDCGYLAQGVAMLRSLRQHDPGAAMWALALDDETEAVLAGMPGSGLRVIPLRELLAADTGLAAVRESRSRREFIFTLTPCWVRHMLGCHPEASPLAYVDADMFFFNSPAPIWDELGSSSIYLVPHRFPEYHDESNRWGRFNVGVLLFRNDGNGRACVEWWRDRCIESCELAGDGSTYGDQKYLDEWPARFRGVVASSHPGVNLAPWNWAAHRCVCEEDRITVNGAPLIVFHFAQFRRITGPWFDSGQLEYGIMPLRLRSRLYGEYWSALKEAEAIVRTTREGFCISATGWRSTLGAWHLALLRLFWGQFWLRIGPWWFAGRMGLGRFSGRAMGAYRRMKRLLR
jgi:hypothetical protein